MKSVLALSALITSCIAAPTRGHAHAGKRAPAPVCKFDEHTFNDANAWSKVSSNSKRDVNGTTWSPPSDLVKPLQEVWDHTIETYSEPLNFMNYGYDQIIASKGKINYCVRWDSTASISAELRTQTETAIRKQYNKWIAVLAGFDGFPYEQAEVNIVGWAVNDKSLLEGDVGNVTVYADTKDIEGIPECDPKCGRSFHLDNDYSGCEAGTDNHYDLSLWLTEGLEGGFGGDWGQQVGREYFEQNVNEESIHIVLHELGHTFGLDDFYDWTPTGQTNFIMLAGSAMEITDFDAWMARDWWRNLKERYSL